MSSSISSGGGGDNGGNHGQIAILPPGVLADGRLRFWWGLLVRITVALALGYVLWRVRAILTTVIVSLVLASAASALVEPLCRQRIAWMRPRTQRAFATGLVFALLFLGIVWSVLLLFHPFQQEWHKLQVHWPTYKLSLTDQMSRAKDWYADLPPEIRRFLEDRQTGAPTLPSPTEWAATLLGTTVSWASHIIELILIPVLAFYFTLDAKPLRNEMLLLIPRPRLRPTLAILREGGAIMRAYIVAQFWLAVIAGVTVGVGLKLIGMDYAVILGLYAGVTRAIPIVGPLIGGIPIVLLSFVYGAQTGNPTLWIWVLIFFTSLHLIESKFVMPKFLSHRLNLHAAIIILALLVGGEFFGVMGMFLAVPVAALGRILLHHYVVRPQQRRNAALARASNGSGAIAGEAAPPIRLLRVSTSPKD